MTSFVDPCTVGPFMCGMGDCRATTTNDDDDYSEAGESMSMLSSIRPSRRKHHSLASAIVEEDNDPTIRQAVLRQRLEMFQSKGWLTEQDHRKFHAFLSTFDNTTRIGENGNYALKELEVELNLLENRMHGKKSMWKKMLTPTRGGRFALFPKSPSRPALGNTTNSAAYGTIIDPSELSTSLSDDAIADLFAETCFFARLGFVQPPCCLQCTYREAKQAVSPRLDCKRWVVWRKNANVPFHPSNIKDNAMIVQCRSARKLLAGMIVESYKWHRNNKILIEPSHLIFRK